MLCKDLKVVSLNITEDFYEYKALFRLCADDRCLDIDLALLDESIIRGIKKEFELEESENQIKDIIMDKIMEASRIESRIVEGEQCCGEIRDEKLQKDVDSLSRS